MVRRRLLLSSIALILSVLVILSSALYFVASYGMRGAIDSELTRRANAIQRAYAVMGDRSLTDRKEPLARQPSAVRKALLSRAFLLPRFFGVAGRPLLTSSPPWSVDGVSHAWTGQDRVDEIETSDGRLRVLSRPLRREGKVSAVVQMAASLEDVQAAELRLRNVLFMLIPFAMGLTGLVSWYLTRVSLRPVGDLARAATLIQASSLSDRLPVTGSDEFARLAQSFNGVLARLESAFDTQKRFTGDVSHELKSPLTSLRLKAEVALLKHPSCTQTLEEMIISIDSMSGMVQDMILLSQSDECRVCLRHDSGNLRALTDQIVDSLPNGDRIIVRSPEEVPFRGDMVLLGRAMRNVIENALNYSPESTAVVVSIEATREALLWRVSDEGYGISDDALPQIFDRFYRADMSRGRETGGSGLGLSLAKMAVEAHGGRISAASTVGKGTTISVWLPAQPQTHRQS